MNEGRQGTGRISIDLAVGLKGRLEERTQRFFTDINERGETRLEELSRKVRQTELWIRMLELSERAEVTGNQAIARIEEISEKALRRAGIATDTKVMELEEQIGRLRRKLERMQERNQVNPTGSVEASADDASFQGLA